MTFPLGIAKFLRSELDTIIRFGLGIMEISLRNVLFTIETCILIKFFFNEILKGRFDG